MTDPQGYYRGKPFSELSREELFKLILWQDRKIREMRSIHTHDLEVLGGPGITFSTVLVWGILVSGVCGVFIGAVVWH